MTYLLRPGIRVVRRPDARLQIGIHPHARTVIPDIAEARELVRCLTEGRPVPHDPVTRRLLESLHRAGVLITDSQSATALAAVHLRPQSAASTLADPAAPPHALAERAGVRAWVEADSLATTHATRLLTRMGVGLAARADDADCWLVIEDHEIARERLDDAVRRCVPHLGVASVGGVVRLGPFVAPGQTACLRCMDATMTDRHPLHAFAIEAYSHEWVGAMAEPIDDAVKEVAIAWAVRDIVAWADGVEPTTWSTSVELDRRFEARRELWPRHPRCGCAWGVQASQQTGQQSGQKAA